VWGEYVEPDFPFHSSVVDARALTSKGWPSNNLTPRGLILKPGHGVWACFDTELLRMSVLWEGEGLTSVGMAPGSYHVAGRKADPGQNDLPTIRGMPWLASGLYPGWQIGRNLLLADPRDTGPDARELSRGPLLPSVGRFQRVRLTRRGAELDYTVDGTDITEWLDAREVNGSPVLQRSFRMDGPKRPLWIVLGQRPVDAPHMDIALTAKPEVTSLIRRSDGLIGIVVEPSGDPIEIRVAMGFSPNLQTWDTPRDARIDHSGNVDGGVDPQPHSRWASEVVTSGRQTGVTNGFAIDHIDLPINNPWRRNVRLADISFMSTGTAAAVTFDGDVWLIAGLSGDFDVVKWKRFTSGLHEPLGIAVRDEEIFVHDRNGIWRLKDTTGNGEADVHELFSNAFVQTAETREFAAGLRVAPDGSFVIGKGGIQASARGRHNGTVLRISPDGETVSVLGWGFREPFIGVHPLTGWVTASDQQGNYVPSTPLYSVGGGHFHGFLTGHEPRGYTPPPVAVPLTWIPHPINASGAGQVWLTGAKMGALNNALIHIGYYRPELFVVLFSDRGSVTQPAIVSFTRDLLFAPLHGAVHPTDGLLYVTGFQIWGSNAEAISGLARIRPTGEPTPLPREVVPMTEGVLLRFDVALDSGVATDPANYSVERWEYRRTAAYGSPHFRPDGARGQETLIPSSAYLSQDRRSVFVGIADQRPVMQLRVGWTLATENGVRMSHNAYLTPRELLTFDPLGEGFDPLTVDLTPRHVDAEEPTEISIEEGARLAELMGCVACHSTDGSTLGRVGPTFKGLYGSRREFMDGTKGVADTAYLRESIKDPAARVVRGFGGSDTGMPDYNGVLTASQIEALILYLKTVE
jgi:cytochrome c2